MHKVPCTSAERLVGRGVTLLVRRLVLLVLDLVRALVLLWIAVVLDVHVTLLFQPVAGASFCARGPRSRSRS